MLLALHLLLAPCLASAQHRTGGSRHYLIFAVGHDDQQKKVYQSIISFGRSNSISVATLTFLADLSCCRGCLGALTSLRPLRAYQHPA